MIKNAEQRQTSSAVYSQKNKKKSHETCEKFKDKKI